MAPSLRSGTRRCMTSSSAAVLLAKVRVASGEGTVGLAEAVGAAGSAGSAVSAGPGDVGTVSSCPPTSPRTLSATVMRRSSTPLSTRSRAAT
ncbi:hypothetical protein ACFPRL_13085 [Pseudoclavibacter helvolus]